MIVGSFVLIVLLGPFLALVLAQILCLHGFEIFLFAFDVVFFDQFFNVDQIGSVRQSRRRKILCG